MSRLIYDELKGTSTWDFSDEEEKFLQGIKVEVKSLQGLSELEKDKKLQNFKSQISNIGDCIYFLIGTLAYVRSKIWVASSCGKQIDENDISMMGYLNAVSLYPKVQDLVENYGVDEVLGYLDDLMNFVIDFEDGITDKTIQIDEETVYSLAEFSYTCKLSLGIGENSQNLN